MFTLPDTGRRSAGPARRTLAGSVITAVVAGLLIYAPPAGAAPIGVPPTGYPGVVVGWGDGPQYHQATPPTSLHGQAVKALAGGRTHSLALKTNGTVVGWGSNSSQEAAPPAGLTGVKAIAAGDYHSLALRTNGTVVAWGWNGDGQATVPAGLTGVIAIAAGGMDSFAVRSNGTVIGWGSNAIGRTTIPAGLTGVTSVAAGYAHVLALRSNGTVVAWGYNGNGQTTVPAGLTGVVAIAAGLNFSLALKSDGTVVGWGYNGNGETSVPAGLTNVTAIAAGSNHSVAVRSDGTVVAWGLNTSGQATVPAGLTRITAVAAGWNHTLVLRMVPPTVTRQPLATTVVTGHKATFVAAASGIPTPTVRWQRAAPGSATYAFIAGATGTTYTTATLTKADQSAHYRAVFTSPAGAATTAAATVTVLYPPDKPTISRITIGNSRLVVAFARGARGNPAVIGTFTVNARPSSGAIIAVRGASSPLAVTGLTNGRTYAVQVAETTSGGTVWSDPVTVTLPVLRLTTTVPKIAGAAKVGSTLTATPGGWGPAGLTLKYQWKANGHAISGATHTKYTVGAAAVGRRITLTVTGTRAGYVTATKTSLPTRAVVRGTLVAPVPAIAGAAKVGATLTVRPGTWGPAPVVRTYRWKANGHNIAGATATSYKIGALMKGKRITVTVTGTKTGYLTAARTSAATAAVK